MKLHLLPAFLRRKSRSSASLRAIPGTGTGTGSGLGFTSTSTGSGFSSGRTGSGLSSASISSPAAHMLPSSDSSWTSSFLQAQKISVADKIVSDVALPEGTGRVESRFMLKSPFLDRNHELQEAFLRFDANGDGKISASELGSVLKSLGDNPSEEELILMVKEVDRDGDGFIDLGEFILLNTTSSSAVGEDLRDAFQVFDADDDGKISAQELQRVLIGLGESCTIEECGRMIRGVDTDGDGFVDFQEFCTMMTLH